MEPLQAGLILEMEGCNPGLSADGEEAVDGIIQLRAFFKGAVVNIFIKFPTPGSAKVQLHGERHRVLVLLPPGLPDAHQPVGIHVLALQVEDV